MKSQLTRGWGFHQTSLGFLIIVLLVLGVFFRFVNLDRKVYWLDEVYTSLRISGYTEAELLAQTFDGHEIGIEDLQKYQRTNPEKGLSDTIKSLAVEDVHPPLYFVLSRFWVQWLGNSVAVTRSLSALISLLVFPCIYWFCRELFESSLVGGLVMALIAVSPFYVLYAQEARPYSLWTVIIVLSSAVLLYAMRRQTKLSWVTYGITLALGFYSHLYFGLIAIGHGIYVLLLERFRLSKNSIAYLLASLAGFLTFVPWIWVIISNFSIIEKQTGWFRKKIPLISLFKAWFVNLISIFFDINFKFDEKPWTYIFIFPLVFLVGYSIYFLCHNTSKKVWLFILTLMGVTVLTLVLPDLILGGQRSTAIRQLVPFYLSIQFAVAYFLTTQMYDASFSKQRIWQAIMAMLISSGVISCIISSQAEAWSNKMASNSNPQLARIINQSTNPLVISGYTPTNPGNLISMSYLLDPKVRLRLILDPKVNVPQISQGFSDVFLYRPPNQLLDLLKKNYKIEAVQDRNRLWRIEK